MTDYDVLLKIKEMSEKDESLKNITDEANKYLRQFDFEKDINIYIPKSFKKKVCTEFDKRKLSINPGDSNYIILFYYYFSCDTPYEVVQERYKEELSWIIN